MVYIKYYFSIMAVTSISILEPLLTNPPTSTIVETGIEFLKYSALIGDTVLKSLISFKYIAALTTSSKLAPACFKISLISSNTNFVCSAISSVTTSLASPAGA